MNILQDIKTALASLAIPIETGVYTGTATTYIVITPLDERNDDIADDDWLTETHSADVNLYMVGNYIATKTSMKTLLKSAGFSITDAMYVEYDTETKQHHFVITIERKEVL